jgi:hypothetical protein
LWSPQVDNGIPIESWFEDPKDTEVSSLGAVMFTLIMVLISRAPLNIAFETTPVFEELSWES